MGQTIFNELKDEFDIELHETLKNYCDAMSKLKNKNCNFLLFTRKFRKIN